MNDTFSFSMTLTDVDHDAWALLFNIDAIALTDPELYARLACEGALA